MYRVLKLAESLNYCGMIDLGFFGPKFTWTNSRLNGGLIKKRIVRCWANADWCLLILENYVLHLPRYSDHCPILLNTDSFHPSFVDKPFRIESIWFSDPSIFDVIRESWQCAHCHFFESSKRFSEKVFVWKKNTFGIIFSRKRKTLAHLLGSPKTLDNRPCSFLLNLENSSPKSSIAFFVLRKKFGLLRPVQIGFWKGMVFSCYYVGPSQN